MTAMLRGTRHAVDDLAGNGSAAALRYRCAMSAVLASTFGEQLRAWRQRRRMSQLDLAAEADTSTRHLSFLETGRATPSREMVLRLAERLDVPLRERNALLVAAGYAPMYAQRPLADPSMAEARHAVELVLAGHEPYPALAVDRSWTLILANRAVAPLLAGVDPALLEPPVNVLRLSLHPRGLAPRIANLGAWRAHLLARLRRDRAVGGDARIGALLEELRGYPGDAAPHDEQDTPGVAVPFVLRTDRGLLSFISTITVFGTPLDVTLSELAIESFFPADAATAERLREGA